MNEETLFHAALAKPLAERAAFLEQACAGNAALRQRLEVLLHAHEHPGSFLAAAAPATLGDPGVETPGTVIGPYKLLEQIGEGGFGVVFMAEQTQPVRRKVALKVLKPGMDTRQVVARFEAERQALAIMDHPNIAKVFDGGATGGSEPRPLGSGPAEPLPYGRGSGRPYFVMELVKGVPITEFCDQNHLTPRQRLELFIPVCQAVQHAHQKGIIHRDLKPSNVLVTVHDTTPVPKVIDFGVAKALGQELTDKTLFTGFAQMIGTPLYMSPEQAGQSGLDIDTRSDIYSLGVLLYELLTGTTPFDKERFQQAAYDEVRRIIREEDPPKPSTRLSESKDTLPSIAAQRHTEPAKLTKLVRGELDWIVMKALEKDRNRRYETANDLAMDVQRYLADEPVQACPPSSWYRLRKFARRNKGRLAVAAGVFLAVTVMAASIGWAVHDRAARQSEIEQAETARRAKVEGQVRDSLNTARTLIGENKLASAREKLAQARAQLGNDGAALASLAAEVAAGEADLERFQQFLDLIDRAHEEETAPLLEPALAGDGSHDSAGTPAPLGTGERRPAAAVPFLLEALQRYGVLERNDWNRTLEGGLLGTQQVEQIRRLAYEELLWLADDVLRRQQEHRSEGKLSPEAAARQALVYLGKAASAHRPTQALYALRTQCRKALGDMAAAQADTQLAVKTPATMALDHFLRGRAAHDAKQLTAGVQAFEAALRLEPTHYWSLMWLGGCLCDLGQGPEDFAGAAWVFTGCILKRPDHAHAYYCRANAYLKLRRYEEAVADSSQAIELDAKHAQAWCGRGVANANLGQPDKAVADYSKAIDLDPRYAPAWNNRGVTYLKLGQPDRAVADFSKAIELDPKYAPAWFNRGAAYANLGRPDKAVADYSKAIELEPKHAHAWNNRGNAYNKLGHSDKAVVDYSKAIDLDPKHPQAWKNRGVTYYHLGQPDKAVADFSKAIKLDPKDMHAWCGRGWAYNKLGQPDKAIADFSKAIELDPKFAHAWCGRGWAYNKLGHSDKAVVDLSKAIELAPNHPELVPAYLLRAQAHSRLAHFEQARTEYQTFLKRAPAHAGAHNSLAWLLATCPDAKLRDPDQAVELARKAVQLAPKEGTYWKTLGVAYYRAGDWTAAVAALDTSRELRQGGDAVDRLFLAMAHRKLANHDEARKAYQQALQWLEKNKEALEKDKELADELRRLRPEAEKVLELKKK